MPELTQEYLKECLHYDPETGIFTWLERPKEHFKSGRSWRTWNTRYSGKPCGSLNGHGYTLIYVNGKHYLAHRLAYLYMTGASPKNGLDIDHIDRDRTNNSWKNLRAVSHQENLRNASRQSNNTSGVPGVHWKTARSKWRSHITVNRRQIHLGYFSDIEEARQARIAAERKYGFVPQDVNPEEFLKQSTQERICAWS